MGTEVVNLIKTIAAKHGYTLNELKMKRGYRKAVAARMEIVDELRNRKLSWNVIARLLDRHESTLRIYKYPEVKERKNLKTKLKRKNKLKMSNIYPWDMAGFKVITTLPIKVFVIDLQNNDNVAYDLDLDLGNKEHRTYLGKITAWAMNNKHSIETMSKNDAEGIE